MWRWWNERVINARLAEYDEEERRKFIEQRLDRVATIYRDEIMKQELCQFMLCFQVPGFLKQENQQALLRRCGQRMTDWVLLYAEQFERHIRKKNITTVKNKTKALIAAKRLKNPMLEQSIKADLDDLLITSANDDPLASWFRQHQDVSGRMSARIQNLAATISQRVAWSFLIEPGRPKTDLSRFYTEFDVLENFFDKVELTAEECSQKSFDANCLFKVRNRKLVCVDWSRVRLKVPAEVTQDGISMNQQKLINSNTRRPRPKNIFDDDFDCPTIANRTELGNTDFINASYVLGGPLLNTFILAQAPLQHTMADFWRMVWQERSEWIFMLCEANSDVAPSTGNTFDGEILLDQMSRTHCPFYWPRFEGQILRFGHLHIQNLGIDMATDPLFTITHLELWVEHDQEADDGTIPDPSAELTPSSSTRSINLSDRQFREKLRLQHWQWNWRTYTDFHWPFRVLLRARHSKRPTILMCTDGCGKSGTLALIEIFLMQLLRGAVSFEHPMLTAAVFLRLQRRHAVANHMQWLFAYRCILHWLQPFVISWYNRIVLGFSFPDHGFCAKYSEIANAYAHRKNLNLI